MNKNIFIIALLAFVTFSGCQSSGDASAKTEKKAQGKPLSNEDEFDQKIAAIENNTELTIIRSLAYNDSKGSTEEAIGYLDKDQSEVKIEEVFSDAVTGNFGTYTFYVEKGKKFASKAVYFDNTLPIPKFIERLTFYNKSEKPIFTKVRMADYEEELTTVNYEITKPQDLSVQRVMQIFNQEGPFESTFQGFADGGGMNYLLVGENTKDGFASSLAIQYEVGDLRKLRANERELIGTPLEVEHDIIVDPTGLTFRVLLSVKIKK